MSHDVFGQEVATRAQLIEMIQLLHIKTNAAVTLSSSTLEILAKTQLRGSSKDRVLKNIDRVMKDIKTAANKFEQSIVLDDDTVKLLYHQAYRNGYNDALFDSSSYPLAVTLERNKRIADNGEYLKKRGIEVDS